MIEKEEKKWKNFSESKKKINERIKNILIKYLEN